MNSSRTLTNGLSLGAPIDTALATLGGRPVEAVEVGGWRTGRATYRVSLSDGRIVKVRQLRARNRVTRAAALVAAVDDPRLPAALAILGAVSVEAWVEGTVLSSRRPTGREIDAAADLLTDLHALVEIAGHRFRKQQPTAAVLARTKHQVEDLTAAGLLTRHDASRLVARVAVGLPTTAPRGVIHGDLRAENLVVTPSGALVSIDNEAVHLDFLATDLGRTWARWPMSPSDWTRFRRRYAAKGRSDVREHDDTAWCIIAAVKGAHRWRSARHPNTDAPLHALARAIEAFV
jgi:aminoglycoside phosphotransferase (APT) family kinase protein